VAKILVIEDDADIRKLLKHHLESEGHDAAFAWDAVTALTVARKVEPDLIILDLGLPGGDGWVVMERLRTLAPFAMIPIVVVSAQPAAPNAERALAAGANAFIEKPFDAANLLAAVRETLGA
jgi:two-component system, OmpR family, KDP operon response regulator KdpE